MIPKDDRWFEDYVPGTVHDCGSLRVTQDEIIEFAEKYDPQPFHTDPAVEGPFGGLVASGWHTAALMMRLYVDHYLSTPASLGGPGIDQLRWLRPVRPGDELHLTTTVLEARPSKTRPDRGLVKSKTDLHDATGALVFTADVLNFLKVRPTT